jgi:hypothetical protein
MAGGATLSPSTQWSRPSKDPLGRKGYRQGVVERMRRYKLMEDAAEATHDAIAFAKEVLRNEKAPNLLSPIPSPLLCVPSDTSSALAWSPSDVDYATRSSRRRRSFMKCVGKIQTPTTRRRKSSIRTTEPVALQRLRHNQYLGVPREQKGPSQTPHKLHQFSL